MENILKRIILENQGIISGKKLISRNYSLSDVVEKHIYFTKKQKLLNLNASCFWTLKTKD